MITIALLILSLSLALVYGLAWLVAGLLSRVLPAPDWLRPGLPWLLVQGYVVGGLLFVGDLPGAPAALLRLGLLVAALSLLFGTLLLLRRREKPLLHLLSWLLAGALPWTLALLLEAVT